MSKRWTLLVVVVTLLGVQAFASAGADKVGSKVTIEYNPADYFLFGKIKSSEAKCESGRSLTVFRLREGETTELGVAKSDSKGSWEFDGVAQSGSYYAVAKKKKSGGILCKSATSPTINVHCCSFGSRSGLGLRSGPDA